MKIMIDASTILAAVAIPSAESQEVFQICSRFPHQLVIAEATISAVHATVHMLWPNRLSAIQDFFKNANYDRASAPHHLLHLYAQRYQFKNPSAAAVYVAAITAEAAVILTRTCNFTQLHQRAVTILTPRVFVRRYGSLHHLNQ
ncbi:MAG: hypothetical protein MR006_06790 [Arcanobacterium sp.]|nr:hypothetical protein [Arcanobacterium sp.]MDY5589242.1 hypothetical protein [Arcanobacterium sp.]